MGNNLFSKSNFFTSEYCCSIVKIGEVKPIEGKDKIGYTLVNGETIVVRKDQVKEGDILIYSSNETQLHKDFLGANNLFESSSYELNANAKDIEPYIIKNKELKEKADNIEKGIKKLYVCSKFMIGYEAELLATEDEDEKKELETRFKNSCVTIMKYAGGNLTLDSSIKDFVLVAQEYCAKQKVILDEINEEIEVTTSHIRSNVGFFNKTGRVRAIRLGGVQSMGYLFSLDELAKYNPNVKDVDLTSLVGEDFDTIEGELFVKAYVPFVPERRVSMSKNEKMNKKAERFDRMIAGEFKYHYDTQPLPKCINRIKPTDKVTISSKLHGTSICIGKLHVKNPIKFPFYKWIWNKFIDLTGLFKSHRIDDYVVDYGNVTSSRTVIKNQYINKDVTEGYYGVDVWNEYGNLLYPFLDNGMTIYGEIIGYLTKSDKMIQKGYDYGCEVGENKIMIYRITTTNEDGTKMEWNVTDVYNWTMGLIKEHPEIANKVHPIDILYHGTLIDLYPDLSLTEHWHENVLEAMREDKKHFGMEKNDPICKNKVPFEGVVLRIDDDEITEAFKLKCKKFLSHEREEIDKGEVDMEMADNYASKEV